jgi:4-hydroxy-2-oxoglutarate aldolase
MIKEAVDGKADSVLVITPTTLTRNRMSYVEAFYRDVADQSPLPVLLYSVPGVTAFELPDDSVSRLAEHPNIVGMKDSGGHPVRMQRILASVPDEFTVFTGATQAITLAVAAGAYGAITASTNYMPEKVLETVTLARKSPLRARPLQQVISRLSAAIEAHGIPGVKAAAESAGLQPGFPRLPLSPLAQADTDRLRSLLSEA